MEKTNNFLNNQIYILGRKERVKITKKFFWEYFVFLFLQQIIAYKVFLIFFWLCFIFYIGLINTVSCIYLFVMFISFLGVFSVIYWYIVEKDKNYVNFLILPILIIWYISFFINIFFVRKDIIILKNRVNLNVLSKFTFQKNYSWNYFYEIIKK